MWEPLICNHIAVGKTTIESTASGSMTSASHPPDLKFGARDTLLPLL